jgi:hypothetical protein
MARRLCSEGIAPLFFISALDGSEWVDHAPAALPPINRPGIHLIGRWVGCRAGLDNVEKSLLLAGLEF